VDITRIEKNAYQRAMIEGCPNEGCEFNKKPLNLEALRIHLERQCRFVDITCPRLECGSQFKRDLWKDHFQQCIGVAVACPHCEERIRPARINYHGCNEELQLRLALTR